MAAQTIIIATLGPTIEEWRALGDKYRGKYREFEVALLPDVTGRERALSYATYRRIREFAEKQVAAAKKLGNVIPRESLTIDKVETISCSFRIGNVSYIDKDLRRISTYESLQARQQEKVMEKGVVWEYKNRLTEQKKYDCGMNLTISEERRDVQNISSGSVKSVRYRQRISLDYGYYRLDLTIVAEDAKGTGEKYECELEYTGDTEILSDWDSFYENVNSWILEMQQSQYVYFLFEKEEALAWAQRQISEIDIIMEEELLRFYRSRHKERALVWVQQQLSSSNKSKEELLRSYNARYREELPLSTRRRYEGSTLDLKLLVQPRNLHMSDLHAGEIYLSPTTYFVAPKADGLRKICVVLSTGIWLLAPPASASMVTPVVEATSLIGQFCLSWEGTIIDGEMIPRSAWKIEKRYDKMYPFTKEEAGRDDIWFLGFDCIRDRAQSKRTGVTALFTLEERIDLVMEFAEAYRELQDTLAMSGGERIAFTFNAKMNKPILNTILTRTAGDYKLYPLDDPAAPFFIMVREVLRYCSEVAPYVTDGVIFTPQTGYCAAVNRAPLDYRRASLLDDTIKWKPDVTVDCAFATDHEGKLHLYVNDDKEKRYIIFDMLDPIPESLAEKLRETKKVAPLVKNAPIAEIIMKRGGVLIAAQSSEADLGEGGASMSVTSGEGVPDLLKLRPEKKFPNDRDKARDNYRLMLSPITEATLSGRADNTEDLSLVFYYHNRIKKELLSEHSGVLCDFGSGKLSILWSLNTYSKVYAIEFNEEYIAEGRKRLASSPYANKVQYVVQRGEVPIDPKIIPDHSVDVVSLFLCLTFFWSKEMFAGLLANIQRIIKPGGKILILTIDGNAVEEALGPYAMGPLYVHALGEKVSFQRTELTLGKSILKLEGNSLYISIPGSRTVPGQIENLVYIRDLLAAAPNFRLINWSRADKELLLPLQASVYSRMFSYGTMAAEAARTAIPIVQPSLTTPQLQNSLAALQALANASAPGTIQYEPPAAITARAESPQMIPAPPPMQAHLVRVNVEKPNNEAVPALNDDLNIIIPAGVMVKYMEENDPVVKTFSLETFENPIQTKVRIATLSDRNGLIHALLKATSAEYNAPINASYAKREALAQQAFEELLNFVNDPRYALVALDPKKVATRPLTYVTMMIPSPEGGLEIRPLAEETENLRGYLENPLFHRSLLGYIAQAFGTEIILLTVVREPDPDGGENTYIDLTASMSSKDLISYDGPDDPSTIASSVSLIVNRNTVILLRYEEEKSIHYEEEKSIHYEVLGVKDPQTGMVQTLFATTFPPAIFGDAFADELSVKITSSILESNKQ